MRVALVSFSGSANAGELGHSDEHVSALATALAEQGDDVVVYARRQTGRDDTTPDRLGRETNYETVQLPAGPPTALTEARAITHLGEYVDGLDDQLRRHRPDVMHSHTWLAGLAAELATRPDRVPLAHTFHELELDNLQPPAPRSPDSRTRTEQTVAQHANRVIALSHAERDLLVDAGLPRDRVSVVPTGVDTERLSPDGPHPRSGFAHRLVVVGPPHRAAPILRAVTALPDTEVVLTVADRPAAPGHTRLAEFAGDLGIADRVRVEPTLDAWQRAALLRSADVVVSCATPGRCDVGYLEAMACGVPVVATSPEAAEAVVHGITGLHLVDAGPRQLARSLRDLLDKPVLRQSMGTAGRDRATARYSWPRIAAETTRIYQELAEHAAGDAPTAGRLPDAVHGTRRNTRTPANTS
jgi:glycosyltransferase involved in cell wall biosynthesis